MAKASSTSTKTRSEVDFGELESPICDIANMVELAFVCLDQAVTLNYPAPGMASMSNAQVDHVMFSVIHLQGMIGDLKRTYYSMLEGSNTAARKIEAQATVATH